MLGRLPLTRSLAGGIVYRHRTIETFALAEELFNQRLYHPGIPAGVRTFVDLGCNVGYFAALLASLTGRRDLRGIAVDANPAMVREAQWLVAENRLDGVSVLQGFVSTGPGGVQRDFYLNDCALLSAAEMTPDAARLNAWTKTTAATVNLEAVWRGLFGGLRCDLLKIDIEGSEVEFITADNPFLGLVDNALLEWHGWAISEQEVRARMSLLGFRCVGTLQQLESRGVLHFSRVRPEKG